MGKCIIYVNELISQRLLNVKLALPYEVSLFHTMHAVSLIKQSLESVQFPALILMTLCTVQRVDGTCHSQRG